MATPIFNPDRTARLTEYVFALCNCPCCNEHETCVDDCSFEEDAPSEYEQMAAARRALFGDEQ